jgi:hypothetical protein
VAAAGQLVGPTSRLLVRRTLYTSTTGCDVVCSVQHEDRGGTEDRVEERTVGVSESGSPLLEVRGLVKDYPGVRALGGVDLTVAAARCIA